MSNEILQVIYERDKLLYTYKKDTSNKDIYVKYCKLRNKIQREVKFAKCNYFRQQVEENRYNPKKLWNQLKNIGLRDKNKSEAKIVLKADGNLYYNLSQVSIIMNRYFTTVASKLINVLPKSKGFFTLDLDKFSKFYRDKGVIPNSFSIEPVSEECFRKLLDNLNPFKSTGLDFIPAKFVKDGSSYLKS